MENFSMPRMMPGVIPPGIHTTPASNGLDMGGIPGFDVVQRLLMKFGLDPSLLVTLGMSLTLISSLLSFFSYSTGSFAALGRFLSGYVVTSATIHSSDVTFLYIMRWLAVNRISTDCRIFCVTSRKNPQSYAVRRYSSYSPFGGGDRGDQEDDDDDFDPSIEDDSLGPKLKYTSAPGYHHFWHLGRPILINRQLDLACYTGDIPDETIILTTIGRSPSFLKDIISEARRDYLLAQSQKTMVYTLSPTPFAQKTWDQGRHRPARDISTVIMPPEEKEHLLQDIKEYLKPSAMNWYAQRGLPYRRGYLFYGPPGTGKTSLSLALAGELKLPLYILSLATGSLTDETLTMLFNSLPRKCIVLLEDIDCAGVYRQGDTDDWDSDDDDADEADDDTDSSSSGSAKNSKSTASKSNNDKKDGSSSKGSNSSAATSGYPRSRISVSFSGLLNAIDGVASHEGRILIMTTNHRERLDKALIRPGRVDVQIEFGHADKETLAEIFRALYKEIGEPKIPGSFDSKDQVDKKRRGELEMRDGVRQMAERFAERIPTNKFTPAEIQGFLMSYKGRPSDALGNIDAWVRQRTKPERKRKSRAASDTRENSAQSLPASTCPASTTTNGITSLEGIHSKSSASSADTSVLLDQITRFNERVDLLLTKQELASKQSSTTTDTDSTTPPPTKAHSNGVLTSGYQYESGDTSEDEPSILQKSKKEESWEKIKRGPLDTTSGINGTSDTIDNGVRDDIASGSVG